MYPFIQVDSLQGKRKSLRLKYKLCSPIISFTNGIEKKRHFCHICSLIVPHLIQGGVGQHLLQGTHRQGLLQDEAADSEVWRDILKHTTSCHIQHKRSTRDACIPSIPER